MQTLAVLPIKSFGAAKQRLSGLLGAGSRQALAQAMFSDVLASLRRVPGIDAIAVVTANAVAQSAARGNGVELLSDPVEDGQSAAAGIGIRHALDKGFDRVLLVPGDTPLVDPGELSALLASSEADRMSVVIVPDRHGTGTNALLLSPPTAMEPGFGPDSLQRHCERAKAAGVAHRVESVPSLMLDVDTPDDLAELADLLEERRLAPMTRGALRQLDRSNVRHTVAPRQPPPPVDPVIHRLAG
jgi:2-phospho-L-lactate guanylyltransferase